MSDTIVNEPTNTTTSEPAPQRGLTTDSLGRIWAVIAGALCVVLLALCVVSSHGVWWGKPASFTAQRGPVLAAAKSCMATMNTYNYKSLSAAETKALACTTGDFTATYKKAFDSQIKQLAPTAKASQTFQVNNAGLERVDPSGKSADVLVFGQIAMTNASTGSTPSYSVLSAVVTMNEVGGHWLVSGYKTSP